MYTRQRRRNRELEPYKGKKYMSKDVVEVKHGDTGLYFQEAEAGGS